MIRSGQVAVVVAGAAVVVLGGASFIGAPDSVVDEHPTRSEPIVRSSLVCPFVDGEDEGVAQVGVLAVPDVESPAPADDQPSATVEALALPPAPGGGAEAASPPAAAPIIKLAERGVPIVQDVNTTAGTSFAVSGVAALAPGLAAEQTLFVQSPDLRGISTAPCTAPGREHWFVGGSGEVGRRGRLIVSNPTDVAAVVDVELWDEAGPVDAPGTRDIAVPARGQRLFLIDALAPGSAAVAARVTTNRGRVSAALELREMDEITPRGMTFIPATSAPAREVVIPGVPGHGQRTLRLIAPGATDAIVSMEILGPDGAFSPIEQGVVTAPAGGVLDVPLDVVGRDAAALRLTSDEPITAAVRVVDTPADDTLPEIAYTAGAEPLSGPSPALLSRTGAGLASALIISVTSDTTAQLTLRTLAPNGSTSAESPMEIPAGATVRVPLTAAAGTPNAMVIVDPARPGTVVAAREIVGSDDDGALLDLMPLLSPTVEVAVPEVAGELPAVPPPAAEL